MPQGVQGNLLQRTGKVLVTDPIHEEGIRLLRAQTEVHVKLGLKEEELREAIPEYEALIVRSETKVTAKVLEAATRLQVIGRAGVGVDNIDVEAATRQGIAVVNAPTGNIVAAAEHTIALLLALARHIPQADTALRQGQWRRSSFTGVEVRHKTLGIIGLGRVGTEVARRAQGLQMQLMAYDPFISPEYAQRLGVTLVPLDRLLREADFITLHVPLTDTTRGMIGRKELALVKPTARLINTARGGIVDEEALYQALEEGRLAGAALDVFAQEPLQDSPLLRSPKVIVTPHLGASTTEAQAEVSREVAEQVLAVLKGEPARNIVNLPFVPPDSQSAVRPYIPVATYAGKLAAQLAEGQLTAITIRYEGEIAEADTTVLKAAALAGILDPVSTERVNLVNASLVAARRGLGVMEHKGAAPEQYGSLVTVEVTTNRGTTLVSGTHMRGEAHIVRIKDYWIDVVPSGGYMLVIDHLDRPGLIGAVGTVTGKHNINISFMEVGRLEPRGQATMVVGLDDPIPPQVLEEIRSIPHIHAAKVVRL